MLAHLDFPNIVATSGCPVCNFSKPFHISELLPLLALYFILLEVAGRLRVALLANPGFLKVFYEAERVLQVEELNGLILSLGRLIPAEY